MPELYAIEKPDALKGKTIIYVNINRFADPAIIITTDGGILMWTVRESYDQDFDDKYEIIHHSSREVESELFHRETLVKQLIKICGFTQSDFDIFFVNHEEERKRQAEIWKQQKEENERKEFERLSVKFSNGGNTDAN